MPDSANAASAEDERQTLKRDMLIGHLLTMAVQVQSLTVELPFDIARNLSRTQQGICVGNFVKP